MVVGWLLAIGYFGVLAAFNVAIASELLRLPSDFGPGWWPLLDSDLLYGGLGLVVVLLVRLAWRRRLSRNHAGNFLPS